MSKRTCSLADCDQPHRARGLCRRHWTLQYGMHDVTCETCGESFKGYRATSRFCSYLCRDLWRVDQPDDQMWKLSEGRPRKPVGPRICRLPNDHPAMWIGQVSPLAESGCRTCGIMFAHRPNSRRAFCSKRCSDRARMLKRRGRKAIRRADIFKRDAYVCWLCDEPTSPTYRSDDPLSPTVDHLIPRSLGGSDEPDNLATAHMICNSRRGVSWDLLAAA